MSPSSLLDARKAARADKHRQDDALRVLHERALALVSDQLRAPPVMARDIAKKLIESQGGTGVPGLVPRGESFDYSMVVAT